MKALKTLVYILILFIAPSSGLAAGDSSDDLKRSVALMAKIGACWSPSFSPDGKQIAFVSDLTGIPQIWIVSASGGWPTQVTALDDRVGAVEWSPDGEMLAFSVAPGGGMNQQVYLVKPDGRGMRRLTDGGKETNWLGGWTFDGKRLTLASNRRSAGAMDGYLADIATGELKLIAINKGVGRFTDTSRDGQRALLARTVSRGDNNLFLVDLSTGDETLLTPHDGPGSFSGRLSPDGKSVYQALLAQGIAVFAPNVRGSSGFGKAFVNLDNGALRVNGIKDIEACVKYAVENNIADPKRIGIMGGSYGGYMVMAGLTEYPKDFAAGANLFGVVNFETFFANTEPWMAAISTIEYGDPKTEKEMLRSLSPIHKIDNVIAPTIVLHGANDTNVPVVEAEQVVDNLKQRGVPVEYILFPDEGHGFRKTPNRIRSTVAIVNWFVKYLKENSGDGGEQTRK